MQETRRTAQIIKFPTRPIPRTQAPVVEFEGWYHAEAAATEKSGRT